MSETKTHDVALSSTDNIYIPTPKYVCRTCNQSVTCDVSGGISEWEEEKERFFAEHPNPKFGENNKFIVDQGRVYEEVLPGVQMHRRDLEDPDDINI